MMSNREWLRKQTEKHLVNNIEPEVMEVVEDKIDDRLKNIESIYAAAEYTSELSHFKRVFSGEIANLPEDSIRSSGYVIDTLEASLWCLLNSSSYTQAVLKAVNLGGDTDTTAAVTGGLAGIYYTVENIPLEWINQIARKEDIINLAARLETSIYSKS